MIDTTKVPYLFKWRCEFYVIPSLLLSILPSNRYTYNFLHKLDSDGLFSINHFLGWREWGVGYSLYGTSKTNTNSFKELLFTPEVSDGESHSQASRIWDCKSNIYLFIWPDVDRINSGHLPLINMCWNNVLDTLSS